MRARWVLVVGVAMLAAGCESGGSGLPPGFGALPPSRTGVPHEGAAGLRGDVGTTDLVSGATTVAVRTADLGPDRVRATTPDGAGVAPVLDADGDTVTVHLVQTGLPVRPR